jgi:hypothetical protein
MQLQHFATDQFPLAASFSDSIGPCSVCFIASGIIVLAKIRRRDVMNTHEVRNLMLKDSPSFRRMNWRRAPLASVRLALMSC